jgi:2-keto-4-pentenoate hydratase/2-oxohepta-3-ene-1,7-dioic acid hydratase in catechol pathway
MKLVTFEPKEGRTALGLLVEHEQQVIHLQRASKHLKLLTEAETSLTSMQAYLEQDVAFEAALTIANAHQAGLLDGVAGLVYPLSDVRLRAVLPRPTSLRDAALAPRHLYQAAATLIKYEAPAFVAALDRFLRLLGRSLYGKGDFGEPRYYKGNPNSVIGTGDDVQWPAYSFYLDYEPELAVVIGKGGRDFKPAEAKECIAGFTIFNDLSARDVQFKEMRSRFGPAKSKDFDTGNILGPCLVTPDELGDPLNLSVEVSVNGEVRHTGSTREYKIPLEELLSYISQSETLYSGDVIGMGAVPDCCCLEADNLWPEPGDLISIKFEKIGTLTNRFLGAPNPESIRRWPRRKF